MRVVANLTACLAVLSLPLSAQRPNLNAASRTFVAVDAPVVALTHARLVDGTGTPAKDDQTILITGDKITAVGKTRARSISPAAR